MFKSIGKLLISMLALIVTAKIIPGVEISSISAGFYAALILGVVNTFIKPIFTIFTLPLTVLTLGLFLFVINGLMLLVTASLVSGFYVSGIFSAILASIVLSLVNSFMLELL